jgi:hypothetical protein
MRALSASMSAGCEAPQALESETALEVAERSESENFVDRLVTVGTFFSPRQRSKGVFSGNPCAWILLFAWVSSRPFFSPRQRSKGVVLAIGIQCTLTGLFCVFVCLAAGRMLCCWMFACWMLACLLLYLLLLECLDISGRDI